MLKRNIDQDFEEAGYYFKQAAQQGHIESNIELAKLFLYGLGVDEDYEIAAALLIEAADHGYSEAKVELGLMYAK